MEQKEQMLNFVWIFELKAVYEESRTAFICILFGFECTYTITITSTFSFEFSFLFNDSRILDASCMGSIVFNHRHEQNTQNNEKNREKENKIVPDTIINMITTSVEKLRTFNSENECRCYSFHCFLTILWHGVQCTRPIRSTTLSVVILVFFSFFQLHGLQFVYTEYDA